MQKPDPEDTEAFRSRPTSRKNSASSRRSSVQKDREVKKNSPSSAHSTPKKQVKQNLEFCVTGKQLLKKIERTSSLPGYQRRSAGETVRTQRRPTEAAIPVKKTTFYEAGESREGSLEDDMSLDLSQIEQCRRTPKSDSRQSSSAFCSSRDSLLYKSPTSSNRYGTDLDYSSVSPEYSGQSSTDMSPRIFTRDNVELSPRSQELHNVSSCCISSWRDCSEDTKVEDYQRADKGEWNNFWANYNNSIAKVPMKSYYDQCPTPYRTDDINLADLDFSTSSSRKRSPDDLRNINSIIRNEGLHLTPRETQNIIKCAHILGNVLTKAIERRSKEKEQEDDEETHVVEEVVEIKNTETQENVEKQGSNITEPLPDIKEIKKKTLTLDLKETVMPLEVKEEKRQETVTTQTDISLPNTKSAPRIFEKILRQLSKTSLEESLEKLEKKALESKELERKALVERELKKKELENRSLEQDESETDNEKDIEKEEKSLTKE